jgi:hypothetical protein
VRTITRKALLESTILSCTSIAWLISFINILLSTNGRSSFLLNLAFQQKLTFFLVATGLASGACLIKGIKLLRKPKVEEKIPRESKIIYNSV